MSEQSYPPKPGATPKRTPTYRASHAHYHPVKVSAKWAEMVKAMVADRVRSADQDAARDRERQNETTYARGTTGGS
jgi:hypothetical protein